MGKDATTRVVTSERPGLLGSPYTVFNRIREHRRLIKHLIFRDLKVTYHGTFIGWGWTMVEPLALTAVYWLVFSLLRGNDDPIFVLEILLGVLIYGMFSRTLSRTTTSIVGNSGLIKQVAVPREVFVWSIGGFQSLRFLLSILILPPLLLIWDIQLNWTLLLIPLMAIGVQSLAIGLGMIFSILHVHVRDTSHVVAILTTAGFFLSGVFFGMKHIDPAYHDIFALNPVAVYIEMGRALTTGNFEILQTSYIVQALSVSFLSLLIGSIVFVRHEAQAIKLL
ncbi:MAG: ABC transporter permease [Candidatus Thalassarchaeaceae archaeon]|nr:ABC transporter permease [Candidatus Thalassarchaeaceae archaeon]